MRLALVVWLFFSSIGFCDNIYFIGNSLSYDAIANPNLTGNGITSVAQSFGLSINTGWHILGASSLNTIYNSNTVHEYNPNIFNVSLSIGQDVVVFQPHHTQLSTLGQDKTSIQNFIDLLPNPLNTKFYIYSTWPEQAWWPYSSHWNLPSINNDNTPTDKSKQYFYNLVSYFRENTQYDVKLIPTGEIFNSIANNNYIPLTSLFRDNIHLSNIGKYVASTSIISTVFQVKPQDILPSITYYGQQDINLISQLNNDIWQTILKEPLTDIADLNNDGFVNLLDWNDIDRDGDSDGKDFLILQRHWRDFSLLTIPEPSSIIVAGIFLFLFWDQYEKYNRS